MLPVSLLYKQNIAVMFVVCVIFLSAIGSSLGAHVHSCHGNVCSEIDTAITNVDQYYSQHLCHELLQVNCARHVTQGDEMLCGTDGKTYDNHCLFVHARCSHHQSSSLHLQNHGPCSSGPVVSATTPGPDPATTVTSGPAPDTTTAAGLTTTTTAGPTATSTQSISSIVALVFCQHVDSINCGTDMNTVCGSDGIFYPNECQLSKAKCSNPTLERASAGVCTGSV